MRDLVPVVVDLGPSLPRLEAFVHALDRRGRAASLVLAPIAGDGVPMPEALAERIKIRSTDPAFPFMVQADAIRAEGDKRARVDLRSATLSRLADRRPDRVSGRGPEPLVIALSAGTEELEGYTFLVRDVGPQHCLIETTVPLPAGRSFDCVELHGELRLIRQASASVIETTPWLASDGTRRFRSRLLLGKPRLGTTARGYDVLTDPRRVLRALELAALARVPVWCQHPAAGEAGGSRELRLLSCRGAELLFSSWRAQGGPFTPSEPITIGFELFAISYEATVRVLRQQGGELQTALPLLLRRRRRRREPRARAPGPEATVSYRNPLSGEIERCPVRDLSLGGLCMQLPPHAAMWEGLPLESAVLQREGQRLPVGSTTVRSVQRHADGMLGHLEFNGVEEQSLDQLSSWLFQWRHPQLALHDGLDFRSMLSLYRRLGLLSDFMMRNLEAVAPAAAGSWRRMHAPRANLAKTFVGRSGDGFEGALTSLHAWNRCWFAQHFGVVSAGGSPLSGALQLANLEDLLTRRDAHYLAFFVHAGNARMNAFQERFFSLAGTPEVSCRATVDLWIRGEDQLRPGAGSGPPRPGSRVRKLRTSERSLFCRAVERTLGALPARALSFTPGDVTLDRTTARFRRVGLERSRASFVAIDRRDSPVWGLANERSSAGINLTWMLNAWWMFPIHPDRDGSGPALAAALEHINRDPAPTPTGDRFLITAADTLSLATLEPFGWRHELRAHLYAFTRPGLHRFYHYLADRYGDVAIRTGAREVLRARGEGA